MKLLLSLAALLPTLAPLSAAPGAASPAPAVSPAPVLTPYSTAGQLGCGGEKRVKMPCPGGGSIVVVSFTCSRPEDC